MFYLIFVNPLTLVQTKHTFNQMEMAFPRTCSDLIGMVAKSIITRWPDFNDIVSIKSCRLNEYTTVIH